MFVFLFQMKCGLPKKPNMILWMKRLADDIQVKLANQCAVHVKLVFGIFLANKITKIQFSARNSKKKTTKKFNVRDLK